MDAKRELRRAARSMKRMVGMPDAAPRHFDIPDGAKVLVHVGKSGGTTLRHALDQTELGRQMHVVHIMRPPVRPSLEYYIVARGPVSRALSAFNWRYKLVVADGSQKDRVPGEYELLTRYGTLNALALDLYAEDGTPNAEALETLSRMHHIRENIAFYLGHLLDTVDPAQIKAVLMQESLDADIERVLGVKSEGRLKNHAVEMDNKQLVLEPRAVANLRRFLAPDYACLTRLFCWGKLDKDVFVRTL